MTPRIDPPLALLAELTHRCPLRCPYCSNPVALERAAEELTEEEWRRVLASILDASFLSAQACLPQLSRAGGGSIVNIGGLTAHTGASGRAHVGAAKAGIVGLTRALAIELAPQAITVNCVVPGTIDTVRGLPGAPERPPPRQGLPPLGFTDIFALVKQKLIRVEGDIHPFMANLLYFKDVIAAPRKEAAR
jgi:NAD(P)-dependent dehydrogenase (short-subunit alcohol dehydrogenase family)